MTLGVIKAETSSVYRMPLDMIGGGRVIRAFRKGGKMVYQGTILSAEDILSITPANRSCLIGAFIDVWPKPDTAGFNASSATVAKAEHGAERHVVSLGFNKFHVIEGVKLTDEPIGRTEAYALAGKPEPKKRGEKEH